MAIASPHGSQFPQTLTTPESACKWNHFSRNALFGIQFLGAAQMTDGQEIFENPEVEGRNIYGWNRWSLIFIVGASALLWAGLIALGFGLAQVG